MDRGVLKLLTLTDNLDTVIIKFDDLADRQIPFALSRALNDTMFDVRAKITGETWQNAFEVRNKSLAKNVWRVTQFARKGDQDVLLEQILPLKWLGRQITGGVKGASGGHAVAVPVKQNVPRTSTGRVPAALKPARLRSDTKNVFVTKGRAGKRLIIKRSKNGENKVMFVLTPNATVPPRLRFYDDARATAIERLPINFAVRFAEAKRTARIR